jgi:hypothetical protein
MSCVGVRVKVSTHAGNINAAQSELIIDGAVFFLETMP